MTSGTRDERSNAFAVACATLLLLGLLLLPSRPAGLSFGSLAEVPLELPALVALLVLARHVQPALIAVRAAIVGFLVLLLIVKLADFGLYLSLNRPFNFAYDLPLLHAGWMLAVGTSGSFLAALYVGATGLLVIGLLVISWFATGTISRASGRLAVTTFAIIGFFALVSGAALSNTQLLADHFSAARDAREQIASLQEETGSDDITVADNDMFQAIAGSDVMLVFVESYGRSTLDNPLYEATTKAALNDIEAEIAASGLAARSAYLTAPTVGGQSWLAHASLLSGLWINSQGRYRALLTSDRRSLMRLASNAGWESVAVMPAITMAWPEGAYFGYDRVLAKDDLGYRGLPFNWVTMPDQFTLSAFDHLALGVVDRRPVFAEIALISSHAPWTPIPSLVPWDEVADGTIFNEQAISGDTPAVVWRDHDRVRDQFRQSIDYALRTIGSFAARLGRNDPVIVVVGDHQPAAFVSGTETNRDVPIHVIADEGTLKLLDDWGWMPGMEPGDDAPVWRMDEFRKRFVDAFSAPPLKDDHGHEPA